MSALLLSLMAVPVAEAFCGFYVSGADTSLYNDATMVVLMRQGTKTVLSMQNSYQGPPEAFAMVVPVPQVLQEDNVKTLPREIFSRIDKLASPRLVAYWEQDPCRPRPVMRPAAARGGVQKSTGAAPDPGDLGVKIEAQFSVAEYDVVILSASDSSGLDTWLRQEKYNIPQGAEPVLRPYVESGTKFFVAKVDPERVTFADGRAVLSPLRMHYDSAEFSLPVRLGLLNSRGEQDLLVHILAPGQRYEVANYDNTFIPTNLRVQPAVEEDFGGFYESLFTEVARPRTVVTEYAWDASWCDPCPLPALDPGELATLGADQLEGARSFVLTRLHYRYGADGLDADLVFRAAEPVAGGQGTPTPDGTFAQQGAKPAPTNTFQGRYAILHPWQGEITCDNPNPGLWGGPPPGIEGTTSPRSAGSRLEGVAAKSSASLASLLVDAIPGVEPAPAPSVIPGAEGGGGEGDEAAEDARERRCSTAGPLPGALGWLAVLPWLVRRRR